MKKGMQGPGAGRSAAAPLPPPARLPPRRADPSRTGAQANAVAARGTAKASRNAAAGTWRGTKSSDVVVEHRYEKERSEKEIPSVRAAGGPVEGAPNLQFSASNHSSRIARLAKIRRKRGEKRGEQPAIALEMVVVHRPRTGHHNQQDSLPLPDATHSATDRPAVATSCESNAEQNNNKKQKLCHSASRRSLRAYIVASLILVVVAGVSSIALGSRGGQTSLADIECARLLVAPHAACVYFPSFFLIATLFQPTKGVVASVRRRFLFSVVALLFVSVLALASAAIGYSDDLCPLNCSCVLCDGEAKAGSTDRKTALGCSERESLNTTYRQVHSNRSASRNITCSAETEKSFTLPEVCSIPAKAGSGKRSNTVMWEDISKTSSQLIPLFFTTFEKEVFGNSGHSLIRPDETCEETRLQNTLLCDGSAQLHTEYLSVLFPMLCDSMYLFCDSDSQARLACPDNICCSLCNIVIEQQACNNLHEATLDALEVYDRFNSNELSALGFEADVAGRINDMMNWTASRLSGLSNSTTSWDSCMHYCTSNSLPAWYGRDSDCLANADREWDVLYSPSPSSLPGNTSDENSEEHCLCDDRAEVWLHSILFLRRAASIGLALLILLQTLAALHWDSEDLISCSCPLPSRPSNPCSATKAFVMLGLKQLVRAKEQLLAAVVSVLLVLSLNVQQQSIVAPASFASAETVCTQRGLGNALSNTRLMMSWTLLALVIFYVVMNTTVMPSVRWLLRGVYAQAEVEEDVSEAVGSSMSSPSSSSSSSSSSSTSSFCACCQKAGDAKAAYDELFSYERGRFYMLFGLSMEIVEVFTQTNQLISFSHRKPSEWIVAISVLLMLNGILVPLPFLVQQTIPRRMQAAKLLFAGVDVLFDTGCLLVTIRHSERSVFAENSQWWLAVLGVAVPIIGIARVVQEISESARNVVTSRQWLQSTGRIRPRRRSTILPPSRTPVPQKLTENPKRCAHRAALALSLLLSGFCIVIGSIFLRMAMEGDTACRLMLGDALWEASSPKLVIERNESTSFLQAGCNYQAIKSIVHRRSDLITGDGAGAISRLPASLSRLENLESLILTGHGIASDGVPAQLFDEKVLPNLRRMEFGTKDPVNRVLDLSSSSHGVVLNAFPAHVLRFMKRLESLQLEGQNISCFPERRERSELFRELRTLNLSGTGIQYLPPSILFSNPSLKVDVTGTLVSQSLDWSHHNLGSSLNWTRMALTLPLLTSLDLSNNDLQDARTLELGALRRLRHLDVSHNPRLTPSDAGVFSWWKELSDHPTLGWNASFVGLADVGLGSQHVGLQDYSVEGRGITCRQLHWIRGISKSRRSGGLEDPLVSDRLDLSRNPQLEYFLSWGSVKRTEIRCRCYANAAECMTDQGADEQRMLSEAVYYLLLKLLPNIHALTLGPGVFVNVTRTVTLRGLVQTMDEDMRTLNILGPSISMSEQDKFRNRWADTSIPENIGRLTKLTSLHLNDNKQWLTGSIPNSIRFLTELRSLGLRDNKLSGSIPDCIRELTALTLLNVADNNLSGKIPEWIGRLTLLQRLYLQYNRLSGEIPDEIRYLKRLTILKLENNNVTGRIPNGISELTELRELSFSENDLVGPIPDGVTNLIKLTSLSPGKLPV